MSLVYVGDPAKNYGPQGQPQECVYTDYGASDPLGEAEKQWMHSPWYLVTSTGGLRRDVCVAGHYLRVVLREVKGQWEVWTMPMRERSGGNLPHAWGSLHQGPFLPVVRRPRREEASLAFFRLFQPGPAE